MAYPSGPNSPPNSAQNGAPGRGQAPPAPPYFAPQPPQRGGGVPKGLVIGCLSAVVVAVLLFVGAIVFFVWVIMAATAKPVAAADAFFNTTSTQGAAAAYATTSTSFRAMTTEFQFESVALQARLGEVDHASWNSRNVSNGVASLGGHLHYRGGGDQNVAVKLSKDLAGAWRVMWLDVGPNADQALSRNGSSNALGAASAGGTSGGTGASGPTYLTYDSTGRPLAPPTSTAPRSDGDISTSATGSAALSAPSTSSGSLPLGRAGPAGAYLASGQVAPGCLSPVLQQGFRAEEITCPLRLPAIPGRRETCIAHGAGGVQQRAVQVTFLDWNPITHSGSVDCRLN